MITNDSKYKAIFEITPIPIWEEDFSEIKSLLIEKGLFGQDAVFVEQTLRNDQNLVQELISKLIIVDFNEACVNLHNAKSKEELKDNFHSLFTPEAFEVVIKQLVKISIGQTYYEDESIAKDTRWAAYETFPSNGG